VKPRDVLLISLGTILSGAKATYITSKLIEGRAKEALTSPPPYTIAGRLVSVIIPSLEEQEHLPYLLTSLRNQTYSPIEVIVADSSPPEAHEETRLIAQEYSAKVIFVPKLNVAHARNEGARAASGEILLFCDADCVMETRYVEKLVSALEKGYVLAHGVDVIENGVYALAAFGRVIFKPFDWTTGRGIAIWREAFWEIGGYNPELDPTLGFREDLDIGRKVRELYGEGSIKLLRNAGIMTFGLREKRWGRAGWKVARGVRNHLILVRK